MATYPSIPNPTSAPNGTIDSVLAVKQTIEILTNVSGDVLDSAVTWRQLVALGVIAPTAVPKRVGGR
jgi:hypothetical protein